MAKIQVHPVCIGPDGFPGEMFSPFYPLGCIIAYAKGYQDGRLRDAFEFGAVTPRETRATAEILDALPDTPGVFLLSSYVWNHPANAEFARAVKERLPGSLVLIGGPHVPRNEAECREFFRTHPEIDVAARHEGEITLAEVLAAIADSHAAPSDLRRMDFSGIDGLTFRSDGDLTRTPDRARTMELGIYPSPFTTGEFDHWIEGKHHVPLETNRGCPYGCTFCDWGSATLQKIAKMPMERIHGEIEYAARKKVHAIGICDANFGIFQRDVEIARFLVETNQRYGYPKAVGYTNAKNASDKLLDVIRVLRDGGLIRAGQVSIQTTDEKVLANVERSNIKTTEYRKLIAFFHEEGIPAHSDMMLGLPGQTFETCKKDLQFFFDHMVGPNIYATSAMPNAPMSREEYRRHFEIVVDADGMVESTYSFTREEYARMFELCLAYKLLVRLGILKYLLYFVQLEHGVKALDFIATWLDRAEKQPERYPLSHKIRTRVLSRSYRGIHKDWMLLSWDEECGQVLLGNLQGMQNEALMIFEDAFDLRLEGSAVEAVLLASRAIMPRPDRSGPVSVDLAHDVIGYFARLRKLPSIESGGPGEPLSSRPPCQLQFEAAPWFGYQFGEIWVGVESLEYQTELRL